MRPSRRLKQRKGGKGAKIEKGIPSKVVGKRLNRASSNDKPKRVFDYR